MYEFEKFNDISHYAADFTDHGVIKCGLPAYPLRERQS